MFEPTGRTSFLRSLCGALLVFLSTAPMSAAAAPPAPPVEDAKPAKAPTRQDRIAEAVDQLNSADFPTRRRAAQFLWSTGAAAEPALVKAAQSRHPEVAARAAGLLRSIRSGLRPDTPKDVTDLVAAYRAAGADRKRKLAAAQGLLARPRNAAPILLRLWSEERDPDARRALDLLMAQRVTVYAPLLLAASADLMPGDTDWTIEWVGGLEKRGLREQASALFAAGFERLGGVCNSYPDSAQQHNALAWLCARCGRELDVALEHADKAAALKPDNAAILDTLAEVHFRRGDRDRAAALMKKCLELEPASEYFRGQLKRFEAGEGGEK